MAEHQKTPTEPSKADIEAAKLSKQSVIDASKGSNDKQPASQ